MSQRRSVRRPTIGAAIAAAGLLAGLLTGLPAGTAAATEPAGDTRVPAAAPAAGDTIEQLPDDVGNLPPVGHPARELTIEAEALLGRIDRDAGTAAARAAGQLGPQGFSADKRLVVEPAAEGGSAVFRLAAPAAGRYLLRLDVLTGPQMGRFTVAVNGSTVGRPVDGYAEQAAVRRQVTVGQVELGEGDNTVSITGAGANEASAGTQVSLDVLHLVPQPEQTAVYPGDAAVLSGSQRVVVAGPGTGISVDGTAVDTVTSPAAGSVSLVFASTDFQGAGFNNYVEVSGVQILVPNTARTTADEQMTTTSVTLPAGLLGAGRNTVTIAAGGKDAGCGVNFDDFVLADVRLELPGGRMIAADGDPGEVAVGDGSCGSNTTKQTSAEYGFTLGGDDIADSGSLVADLDTSTLADGPHRLNVDGGVGPLAGIDFVVDNTAPVIDAVSMQPDELLKGTKPLTVEATDATTAVQVSATVDGDPVTIGEQLDSDALSLGSHELVVTAGDEANNRTVRTIRFDAVPERPLLQGEGAPVDGATGAETSPMLRSTWRDPTREDITVDFHGANLSAPSRATRGAITDLPSGIEVPGSRRTGIRKVAEVDGNMLRSTKSSDTPVQTFDLPATGDISGNVEVRWDGTIDPERKVVLLAYDMNAGAWRELASSRGAHDGSLITLRGTVSAGFVDTRTPGRPVVHAMVQGTDPFSGDIDEPADETFTDPSDYTFAVSWMTDTQYLAEGATKPGVQNAELFADAYREMTRWIADNRRDRKIAYSAHTGDIIQTWATGDGSDPARREQSVREFEFASEAMRTLDSRRIPNGVLPGNHDNLKGLSDSLYNDYFGADRYRALSQRTPQPFYGGQYGVDDVDNSNHYDLFSRGGDDFIALYLGYGVAEDEAAWANRVLARYPDRDAILLTHNYLQPSQLPDASQAPRTAEGQFVYDRVVSQNPNVFLVLCGHTHGMGLNIVRDAGSTGHNVVEMLADRQFFEVDGERRGGFLRLLEFDLERGELSVNTYSPYLDNHNSVEFDTQAGREYLPTVDEFTVPIDVSSRSTRFATDAVQLAVEQPGLIGSARVRTNTEAAVRWTGLQPHTRYGWFTRATDSDTGASVSPVFTFTTGARTVPEPEAAEIERSRNAVRITARP